MSAACHCGSYDGPQRTSLMRLHSRSRAQRLGDLCSFSSGFPFRCYNVPHTQRGSTSTAPGDLIKGLPLPFVI